MNSSIKSRLAEFNQEHLHQFRDQIDDSSRQLLDVAISQIDLDQIAGLFNQFRKIDTWANLAKQAEPPTAIRIEDESANFASRNDAIKAGEQALSSGMLGMILVAGGQGSRLGFEHPKGMYPLSPVAKRTLFQIHIDKLKAINSTYDCTVPLYVMTSPATDHETRNFLDKNHWFGYPKDACKVFCQGTMPAVDCETGKILMSGKDRLFASPDGHGGMLSAIDRSGCLEDMKSRNLSQIFYCQIDNPLCQICDAATIGYHLLAKSEMSAQAVPKTDPLQKVGNFVSIDGKVQIIEYSDLPEQIANYRNPDGTLVFWAGNIAVHIFDVTFLDRMTRLADALPFHLAHKKVPFINEQGDLVQPDKPNAIKFERFIFDLLPMAEQSIVVEVDPKDAFSPVKNAATEASNTAFTAQQSMIDHAKRVLADIGVEVAPDIAVEVGPELVIDREKLKQVTAGIQVIEEPVFLK